MQARRFSGVLSRPEIQRRNAARSARWTQTFTPASNISLATARFTARVVCRSVSPGRSVSSVSISG